MRGAQSRQSTTVSVSLAQQAAWMGLFTKSVNALSMYMSRPPG